MGIDVYDFKPSLASDMEGAELVISHAGAGCIMESLRSDFPSAHCSLRMRHSTDVIAHTIGQVGEKTRSRGK
jgi:UDP-N-acetylglucosamine transferase subunit ALG13